VDHTIRVTQGYGWYTVAVVRYLSRAGELVCPACYDRRWSTEQRQTCSLVLADDEPHCDEPCDLCGAVTA